MPQQTVDSAHFYVPLVDTLRSPPRLGSHRMLGPLCCGVGAAGSGELNAVVLAQAHPAT